MELEKLREQVLKLTEENKTLKEDKDGLTKQLSDYSKKITDLQEHNQKLFLRVTSNVPHGTNEEEEESKGIEDLLKSIL